MSRYPIPAAALDDRLAFTGVSGSGKSYNAGTAIEMVLSRNSRVVIIDPLGVWWGLRLMADGRHPSNFNVAIFGGPHGDLPLTEHAGALIGETVAGMAESCILDLSQLGTKAAERRFMLAFLTALYRKTAGEPLHVVFDEADMFAPQRLLDKEGEAAKLLGMMETIVRRGRVKGFIPWLITQRPAVLSKDVLSQADGLIAFKLTSSQDRDAIGGWIEGQADKATGREILASLPGKQVGEGVVWVPGRGILTASTFPQKLTFDSSRTPKRGEKAKRTAALQPLDLGKLQERLKAIETEAKANDPKALRAEIASLKAAKAKLEKDMTAAKPVVDHDALKKAEERGFEQAKKKITGAAEREADARKMDAIHAIRLILKNATDQIDSIVADWQKQRTRVSTFDASPAPAMPRPGSGVSPLTPSRAKPATQIAISDGNYTRPQVRVLESLAMWKMLGHDSPSREMVAAVAGYSPSSGGFNNLLGGLATHGVINKPMPGHLSLAVDGIGAVSQAEGRDKLIGSLSNPQRKLVNALNGATDSMTREELGEATGYSTSSGGFNNLIGSLGTLGIIDKPAPGHVALSHWAQELFNGFAA